MPVHRVVARQPGAGDAAELPAGGGGEASTRQPGHPLDRDVALSDQGLPAVLAEQSSEHAGRATAGRQRQDVRGRALEHRDVGGPLGERGDQGDRGRAAADHHHPLPRPVQVCGPFLRVHDRALEVVPSLEVRCVALVVPEVAGGAEQPPGPVPGTLTGDDVGHLDRPQRLGGGPLGADHARPDDDVIVEVVLRQRRPQIGQDPFSGSDRVVGRPRSERVRVGLEIGVGPDAGITEQVPGAPGRRALLHDHERLGRVLDPQIATDGDAGEPGPDDQHVEGVRRRTGGAGGHGPPGGRSMPFPPTLTRPVAVGVRDPVALNVRIRRGAGGRTRPDGAERATSRPAGWPSPPAGSAGRGGWVPGGGAVPAPLGGGP